MADSPSERHPRPAPELEEPRPKTPRPWTLAWLSAWWPAMAWAGVIFLFSTDTFSPQHTGVVLARVLHWISPTLTERQFHLIHHVIRKGAHFIEYFVFGLLIYRAVRGKRPGWGWTWGLEALFLAAAYSALDEVHQAFVASRTASVYDSLLDSVGALAAFLFLFFWFQLRRPGGAPQSRA